jgi:hypothetical protein
VQPTFAGSASSAGSPDAARDESATAKSQGSSG